MIIKLSVYSKENVNNVLINVSGLKGRHGKKMEKCEKCGTETDNPKLLYGRKLCGDCYEELASVYYGGCGCR